MEAEPSGGASLPISQGRKHSFRSDGSEEAIQACYDLLSSGQPLPEILVALKRLGPLNKAQLAPCVASFDTQNLDLSSERRSHQWAIDQATPFVEANLSLVPLNISQSQLLPHNREKQSNKNGRRAIGTALFWLIPAMSLMLLAGAGKLLNEAVVLHNVEFLTAVTETTAPRSSITAVSNIASHIAPEQFAAARADEADAAARPAEPTTPAAVTGSVRVQHRGPLDNGKSIRENAAPGNSSPLANRASSAQAPHTQNNHSSPKGWALPRRLTDGF